VNTERNRSKVLAQVLRAATKDIRISRQLTLDEYQYQNAVESIEAVAVELEQLAAAIAPPGKDWVVWSFEHDAWWGANHMGYSASLLGAGLYSEEAAREIERRANAHGDRHEMALSLAEALAGERTRLSLLFGPVVLDALGVAPDPAGGARG
jgi:hypothetical protein